MSASRVTLRTLCKQAPTRLGATRAAIRPAQQQVRSYAGIKDESRLGGPGGQADPFGKDKTGRQVNPKPRDNLATVTAVGGVVLLGGAIYLIRTQKPEANFDAARNAAAHTASEAASELAGNKKINSRAEQGLSAHRAE